MRLQEDCSPNGLKLQIRLCGTYDVSLLCYPALEPRTWGDANVAVERSTLEASLQVLEALETSRKG